MAFPNSTISLFFLLSLSQPLTHSRQKQCPQVCLFHNCEHIFFPSGWQLFKSCWLTCCFCRSTPWYELRNGTAYRIITMSKICTKCETQQTFNFNFNIKFKDTHTHINKQWMAKREKTNGIRYVKLKVDLAVVDAFKRVPNTFYVLCVCVCKCVDLCYMTLCWEWFKGFLVTIKFYAHILEIRNSEVDAAKGS